MTSTPALTGSTKQIEWAERLRTERLDTEIEEYITSRTKRATPEQAQQVRTILAPILREVALRQTDAFWWIDNTSSRTPPAGIRPPGYGSYAMSLLTDADKARYQDQMAALMAA